MSPVRHGLYIILAVVIFGRLQAASGTKNKRSNRFIAIANKIESDKVTAHNYAALYDKYLQPIAGDKLRLLEVGLGCGMPNGPGNSLKLWTEFLPNSEISFVEFTAGCAEEFREEIEKKCRGKLYVGDQANVTFLNSIIEDQAGRKFDVIIDDGGHTMEQQKTTVSHLWQLVAPGGIFVMEDLLTSYLPEYGGGPKGHPGTTIEMHKDMLDGLHCKYQEKCAPVLEGLLDMDCFFEACVMVKQGRHDPS